MRGSPAGCRRWARGGAALLLTTGLARAAILEEPLTFQSRQGVLDILVVAKAAPVDSLSPFRPLGWVYDICLNPHNGANDCPPKLSSANLYGGTRLQLWQGDTLKIHLVNKLPPITDADHAKEPGEAFLALNPTNLHTHGMLVSPHYPSPANPTWGDNVFVLTFNSANGNPAISPHLHATVEFDATDYEIKIPKHHPSGLFWFHPHAHGIALNQVSAGMAGIITVGSLRDYVCASSDCRAFFKHLDVRHIILKDSQILANGTLFDQEDPDFCEPPGGAAPSAPPGQGSCPGVETDDGNNYTGGRWFFTLNGQQFPEIPIKTAAGEIWRITNASGSVTYDLSLWDEAQRRDMMFQVLSIDGTAISPAPGSSAQSISEITAHKIRRPVDCPGVTAKRGARIQPLCTTRLHMMPNTRAEIWVAYRDAKGLLTAPPSGAKAIFRTNGFMTGPDADNWPAVDLAAILFQNPGQGPHAPAALSVEEAATPLTTSNAVAPDLASANTAFSGNPSCKPLPKGHKRRIFLNAPADQPDGFGLGYEEVDENNVPVPGTFVDVKPFDPMRPTVCLPLGPGNSPVTERWELVNLAAEDHNFHMHQVRFRVLSSAEIDGTSVPSEVGGNGVVLDSVPLLHAEGQGCASVDDWRKGLCTAHPAVLEIPFTIAGDFVYHCHILEHEDGGMMAVIRVRPAI